MRLDASAYKWLLFPLAVRELDGVLANGFPERLRPALRFLLSKRLDARDRALVRGIDALRQALSKEEGDGVEVFTAARSEPAAGDANVDAPGAPGAVRHISWRGVSETLSVPWYWGAFLYLAATANRARTILELGGCAGISGCYLASGRECRRFITVEGSRRLAQAAEANLRRVSGCSELVNADFESALDAILPTLADGLDMVFIDGQHDARSTLHYHSRVLPRANPGCLIVFDDIHYTPEMTAAWETLSRSEGIAHSLNVGRFGICVRGDGTAAPKRHDLSAFTYSWGRGKARSLAF